MAFFEVSSKFLFRPSKFGEEPIEVANQGYRPSSTGCVGAFFRVYLFRSLRLAAFVDEIPEVLGVGQSLILTEG